MRRRNQSTTIYIIAGGLGVLILLCLLPIWLWALLLSAALLGYALLGCCGRRRC